MKRFSKPDAFSFRLSIYFLSSKYMYEFNWPLHFGKIRQIMVMIDDGLSNSNAWIGSSVMIFDLFNASLNRRLL